MNKKIKIIILIMISMLAVTYIAFGQSYRDNPDYKKAMELQNMADAALKRGEYDKAYEYSQTVIQILDGIKSASMLPKYYTVRLITERRDCFWRIAGYKFVYNDPWKWRILYKANKSKLKDPDNPSLILPGQVFVIPNLNEEKRSGTYNPDE